jgi:hypothetical protein
LPITQGKSQAKNLPQGIQAGSDNPLEFHLKRIVRQVYQLKHDRFDSELIQKAQITGVQTADVVNAMTHHAKPFHSQTGSKTAPTIGIKA